LIHDFFYFDLNHLNRIKEFKFAFNMIDADGRGSLALSELGSLLRASGLNPSLKKIEDITNWLEANGTFVIYLLGIVAFVDVIHIDQRLTCQPKKKKLSRLLN
jgi:Ca2+-binding EF-hand superfamily protein